jgi:hypothetical protein
MKPVEFYYGVPESHWTSLIENAENIFVEEEIGDYIIGVYPTGQRMLGLETESPSILCLFLDIESLFNPFKTKQFYRKFNLENFITIEFLDFYTWIKLILNKENILDLKFQNIKPITMIAPFIDSFFQEEGIAKIIEKLQDLISIRKRSLVHLYHLNELSITNILETRMLCSFLYSNVFYSCINPNWTKVYNFDNNLDIVFCSNLLQNNNYDFVNYELPISANAYYWESIIEKAKPLSYDPIEIKNKEKEFTKDVIKFYKGLI